MRILCHLLRHRVAGRSAMHTYMRVFNVHAFCLIEMTTFSWRLFVFFVVAILALFDNVLFIGMIILFVGLYILAISMWKSTDASFLVQTMAGSNNNSL